MCVFVCVYAYVCVCGRACERLMVHSVTPAPLVMQRRQAPLLSVWPGWMSAGVDEPCLPWVPPHLLPHLRLPEHSQEQPSVLALLNSVPPLFRLLLSALNSARRVKAGRDGFILIGACMLTCIDRAAASAAASLSCRSGRRGNQFLSSPAPGARTLQHFPSYQTGFRLQQ